MSKPPSRRTRNAASSARPKDITGFLGAADKDYLAARVLFNARLPLQAAVLASTALEKYCKTILAFRGNRSDGHLKKAHINAALQFLPEWASGVPADFFELARRCYSLRYTDTLPSGFSLVLADREFLAELDAAAVSFHEHFALSRDGARLQTVFHEYVESADARLILNNHRLLGLDKGAFIASAPQLIYEARNHPVRGFMETLYFSEPGPSDGAFLRVGFEPDPKDENSFTLAFRTLRNATPTSV